MSFSSLAQDFIDLFSGRQSAHLSKYVHLYRPEIFDQLVNTDTYYPYTLECKLIKNHAHELASNLPQVSHIIELGPGPLSPVKAKSVPMIAALESCHRVEFYSAVDFNAEYAESAREIVSKKFNNIIARAAVLDFSNKKEISNINLSEKHRNLIICLGGTIFCAGNEEDIDKVVENISNLLKPGEHFIFGADISDSEQALRPAYFTDLSYQLMLNAMHGLKQALGDSNSNFDPTAFEPVFRWNERSTTVELLLRATRSQNIIIDNTDCCIVKDVLYNILNSRKTSVNEIKLRLSKYKLEILNIYETKDIFGNKFALLKTKKT